MGIYGASSSWAQQAVPVKPVLSGRKQRLKFEFESLKKTKHHDSGHFTPGQSITQPGIERGLQAPGLIAQPTHETWTRDVLSSADLRQLVLWGQNLGFKFMVF